MEKQAMYLEEWHVATEQMEDFLDSIVSLAGEGRAFTIETLVSAYGKAQEQATRAMLEAGFKDYQDIMAAWIHQQEDRELANAE